MIKKIEVIKAKPRLTAAVRTVSSFQEFGNSIVSNLEYVYKFLRSISKTDLGKNVVLYLDKKFTIEIGVIIFSKFINSENIICSGIPGGKAVMTVHQGPYKELYKTHRFTQDWSAEKKLKLAGPNWEIYGDWNDDPDKLETEIFYLVNE